MRVLVVLAVGLVRVRAVARSVMSAAAVKLIFVVVVTAMVT